VNATTHYTVQHDGAAWTVAGAGGEVICYCEHWSKAHSVADALEMLWREKHAWKLDIPPTHERFDDSLD